MAVIRKNAPVTPTEVANKGRQTKRRTGYERRNPVRMQGIGDQPFGVTGRTATEAGVSPALLYKMHGIEDNSPHPAGQQELPGMQSVRAARESGLLSKSNTPAAQSRTLPDLAPAPKRWEEMSGDEQSHTLRRAAQFGVTPESVKRSFSAQLDQGHLRASAQGMTPYASHFYSGHDPSRPSTSPETVQPRDRLVESMKANGTDFSTQVLANAITSPKSKFRLKNAVTGQVRFPNDEAANSAIAHAQAGGTPDNYVKERSISALTGNVRRAVGAVNQRQQGKHLDEIRNPGGSSPFGPKTGPYNNSFIDPHGSSQFFVSDVHSGGAGMAPHLSHSAPYTRAPEGGFARTASGKLKKDKSERETYLEIPGIHALHDHVVRQVLSERGLQSTSHAQATQWGEEQIQRGEHGSGSARKQTLVSNEDAYGGQHYSPHHGQMDLFSEGVTAPHGVAHTALSKQFKP